MPAAARVGDNHRCHHVDPAPHVGGEILPPGCETVFIGDEPAARTGDKAFCSGGEYDVIVTGEPTVLIGDQPAARLGDATAGGHVTTGFPTVQIGPHPQIEAFRDASRSGVPFCEKHVRTKVARGAKSR
jgi:uncharacterized Zn-binding protein involved in type VI secretion